MIFLKALCLPDLGLIWFAQTEISELHDDFKISSANKFYKRFPCKISKLSMIFLEASPRG